MTIIKLKLFLEMFFLDDILRDEIIFTTVISKSTYEVLLKTTNRKIYRVVRNPSMIDSKIKKIWQQGENRS